MLKRLYKILTKKWVWFMLSLVVGGICLKFFNPWLVILVVIINLYIALGYLIPEMLFSLFTKKKDK